jgi:hypothetical protein
LSARNGGAPSRTRIERFELPGPGFARWLDEWRQLKRLGWDVHVLLARDESHCIALACEYGDAREPEGQLELDV